MKRILIFLMIVAIAGWAVSVQTEAGIVKDVSNFLKNTFQTVKPTSNLDQQDKKEIKEVPLYKPVIDYEDAVVRAVEEANPSVVSIVVTKDLPVIEQCPSNPFGNNVPKEFRRFFEDDFFQFYQPCQKGTEKKEVGGGTGFVVSSDGLVATNKHVVLDKEAEYTVLTNGGEKYDAEVLARDPVQDIAVLKIDAEGLDYVKLGDSDSVKLGQSTIAIGNALGEFRNTVSVGVVSGLARTITASSNQGFVETIEGVIQTDAAINRGNSGGPLLNLQGEVIGMNTAIVSGAQNIGFAIPINQVKRDIESVRETGEIKIPYLGIRYIPITPEVAKQQGLSVKEGALLRGTTRGPAVIPGSPAEKAGLKAEDIILEMNSQKITPKQSLATLIKRYNIGDTVTLKIQRNGEIITKEVKLGELPDIQ